MYAIEIYEQVAKLAHFSYKLMIEISDYAKGSSSIEALLNNEKEFVRDIRGSSRGSSVTEINRIKSF
jgi:hypothetical protein